MRPRRLDPMEAKVASLMRSNRRLRAERDALRARLAELEQTDQPEDTE